MLLATQGRRRLASEKKALSQRCHSNRQLCQVPGYAKGSTSFCVLFNPKIAFLTSLSDEPSGMQRLKDLLTVKNRNFNRGRVLPGPLLCDVKALKGRHIQ